jgi:hypothetical protein
MRNVGNAYILLLAKLKWKTDHLEGRDADGKIRLKFSLRNQGWRV